MKLKTFVLLIVTLLIILGYFSDKIYSGSIDFAHHYVLINKIKTTGNITGGYTDNLQEMALYPPAAHWLTSGLAKFNDSIILSMNIVVLISFVLIYFIISKLVIDIGFVEYLMSMLVILLLAALKNTFPIIGFEVVNNYFFSQFISMAFSLVFIITIYRVIDRFVPIVLITSIFTIIGLAIHPLPVTVALASLYLILIVEKYKKGKLYSQLYQIVLTIIASGSIFILHPYTKNIANISQNNGWLSFKYLTNNPTDINSLCVILIIVSILMSAAMISKIMRDISEINSRDSSKLVISSILFSSSSLAFLQYILFIAGKSNPYTVKKYLFVMFTFLIISIIILISDVISSAVKRKNLFLKINKLFEHDNNYKYYAIPVCIIALSFVIFKNYYTSIYEVEKYQKNARHYYLYHAETGMIHNTIALFNLPQTMNYLITIADMEYPRNDISYKLFINRLNGKEGEKYFVLTERKFGEYSLYKSAFLNCVTNYVYFSPILEEGTIVNFSNVASGVYLKSGFSATEPWGVWSDGKTSILEIQIDQSSGNTCCLELEVQPIFVEKHTDLKVSIKINDMKSDEWFFNNKMNYPIKKILKLLPNTGNKYSIRFDYDNTISPYDLKLSEDKRKLALGFFMMRLVKKQ